ncbi:nose resistant to fluoxetine protein 6 [Aedes aegypti]|uniref:Nose resistant-to-fluoxetine protein N-terminal domain-containing protein n=1 Tax=Aedes aegypti TaxID=7159 RepID=A0A1S4FXG2_AEDAE|nr:nose resistant to fluoxetine protein 6 [Aedes aegypti]
MINIIKLIVISLIAVNLAYADNDTLCDEQLQAVLFGVSVNESWALQLYDAWGKWPSGQFSGNQYDLGNYDQCRRYSHQHANVGLITGRYCMVVVPEEGSEPEMRIFIDAGGVTGVVVGMCFPSYCNEQRLKQPVSIVLETIYRVSSNGLQIQCETEPKVSSTIQILTVSIFSVILAFVVASTVYEVLTLKKLHRPSPVFIAFSVYSNWLKLMKTTTVAAQATEKSNVIDCIHGMRVLAIVWIIFGHSYLLLTSSPLINPIATVEWIESFHSTLTIACPLSVDTFFLLSGLLTCWSLMKELDRSWFLNVPLMYLHRYLRLTPVFAALILFTVGILPNLSSGPLWNTSLGLSVDQCNQYWWSALLYVQNYVNPDQICLGHSWYLSVDMQLFLLSPLLIYPLWKFGKRVLILVGLLIATSMIYIFVMFMVHDFPGSVLITDITRDNLTYLPTHTRMGAWLIGVITGYVLYRTKNSFVRLDKSQVILGWTLSLAALVGCIVGAHYVNQPFPNTHAQIFDALYESLKHVVWAFGVAWIIFACTNGYGGPVNSVLSLSIWQPLGRLSYCLYLLHLPMQTVLTASTRTTRYFSDLRAIHTFWGDFSLTLLASVGWTLCFEIPFANLDVWLLGRAKKLSS